MSEVEYGFRDFLQEGLQHNPLKCEYYLPSVVSRLLDSNKAEVKSSSYNRKVVWSYLQERQTNGYDCIEKSWKRIIFIQNSSAEN